MDAPASTPRAEAPAALEAPVPAPAAPQTAAGSAQGGSELAGLDPVVEQERPPRTPEHAERGSTAQADSPDATRPGPDLGILSLAFGGASLIGLTLAALTARRVWTL